MAQSLFEELIAIDPYKDIDQTEYVDPKGETGIQDYLLDIIRAPIGGVSDASSIWITSRCSIKSRKWY